MANVMITGANGYIGKHVVKAVLDRGHKVYALDVVDTGIDERAEVILCSIFEDSAIIDKIVDKVDVCIHMAWRNGFEHESMNHINDLPNHYKFLCHVIDKGVKKIAVMGTAHEIGYYEGKISESTPCHPKSLYGMSKDMLRRLCFKKIDNLNVQLYWLRAYYILGDDRSNHSVFTKILEANERGDEWFSFTSGKNRFDFIHVKELATQIAATVEQDTYTGIINVCSGKPLSLGEKMEEFIRENGLQIKLKYNSFPDRIDESPITYGDDTIIKCIMEETK